MIYKKTLLPVVLLSVILSIISCSKSEKEAPSLLAGKVKLIRGVGDIDQSITEYQYDNKGFLSSINYTTSDGITGSFTEFKNDGDGKPVVSTIYATKKGDAKKKYATLDLMYENNRLIEDKQVLAEGGSTSIRKYIYNKQNNLESSTTTIDANTQNPYLYQSYTFTLDGDGIVTGQTKKTYVTGSSSSTVSVIAEKYEFDDKINPFASKLNGFYQPHNTIKTTVTYDKIPGDLVVVFTFDYNADGLPIKQYVREDGNMKLIKLYEYY
ncbi:MAG: hypothetical protein V4594_17745 [Bacteroidota bacterium]